MRPLLLALAFALPTAAFAEDKPASESKPADAPADTTATTTAPADPNAAATPPADPNATATTTDPNAAAADPNAATAEDGKKKKKKLEKSNTGRMEAEDTRE